MLSPRNSHPMTPQTEKPRKRFKLFKFFYESFFGVTIGFVLVSVLMFCCFSYLGYKNFMVKGLRFSYNGELGKFTWLKTDNVSVELRQKDDFLDQNCKGCDLFDGDWIWDEKYPLYLSKHCRFIDPGFRCNENGRPDSFYTKWRWQPNNCNMPRFDAKLMLEKLRNRRLVFVGDSIGRNQWESLLCMLSTAVSDNDSIYEVNGNPITKHNGFLVFKFKDFNCTVEYYRAPFLVVQSRPPAGSSQKIKSTLKLDQMDWSYLKWRNADVIVFNTGHWWNYGKTIRGGCYFQEGAEVKMDMDVDSAYKRAMETVMKFIHKDVNPNKTQVVFRTYAPVHFRNGNWKNGGTCHLETVPDFTSPIAPSETWPHFRIITGIISSNASNVPYLDLLNITSLSSQRKDGHASIYYTGPNNPPAPLHRQDCSHWCLPGVPDTWNELLYSLFLKRESTRVHPNSSTFQYEN